MVAMGLSCAVKGPVSPPHSPSPPPDESMESEFETGTADVSASPRQARAGSSGSGKKAGAAGLREAPASETIPEGRLVRPGEAGEGAPPGAELESGPMLEAAALDGRFVLPATVLPVRAGRSFRGILAVERGGRRHPILPLQARYRVYIAGPRARVEIDYVFENRFAGVLDATFLHGLPTDAVPVGLSVFERTPAASRRVSLVREERPRRDAFDPSRGEHPRWGSRIDGRVTPRADATRIYDEVLSRRAEPGLLEWGGGQTFSVRMPTPPPGRLKRVRVAYETPVHVGEHGLEFAVYAPADSGQTAYSARFVVDGRFGPVSAEGFSGPVRREGDRLTWDAPVWRAGRALRIRVQRAPVAAIRGIDPRGPTPESFYARVRLPEFSREQVPTGSAVFLVDTSLSSARADIAARRAALIRALLERDPSIEQYAVLLFDVHARWMHGRGYRPNTASLRAGTFDALARVTLEGATDFHAALGALQQAQDWLQVGGRPTVFVLSDGEGTWGASEVNWVGRYPVARQIRWIAYAFRAVPFSRAVVDALVEAGGGRTISVVAGTDLGSAAEAHRMAAARLESVRVRGERTDFLTTLGRPREVYAGQVLSIAGRLAGSRRATLELELTTPEERRRTLRVDLSAFDLGGAEEGLAGRAWADLYIRRLLANGSRQAEHAAILLGAGYGLAHPEASFVLGASGERTTGISRALEALRSGPSLTPLWLRGVPSRRRAFVRLLERNTKGLPPWLRAFPLRERPLAGGANRAEEEARFLVEQSRRPHDFAVYERLARVRAQAGDTRGTVRALSSLVELLPQDPGAVRLSAYALLGLGQHRAASTSLVRLRCRRPHEPQVHLEEALALSASGRFGRAAARYEAVLAGPWAAREPTVRAVAAVHYRRLLEGLQKVGSLNRVPEVSRAIAARLRDLGRPVRVGSGHLRRPLTLTLHGTARETDVDLVIVEPSGTQCQKEARCEGRLLAASGQGPELYVGAGEARDAFDVMVQRSGAGGGPVVPLPTAVLVVVDRMDPRSRRFLLRVLPRPGHAYMVATERL